MVASKIKVFFESGKIEEIEIVKYKYGVNDYSLNHPKWKYFQYDNRRPSQYMDEDALEMKFQGYLISQTIKGKRDVVDCYIKIIK